MWRFDPSGKTMDVYDHEGTKVASGVAIAFDADGNPVGVWSGDYPDRVKDIARNQMDGDQPSAYNQGLLSDMAADNIERGTPA